MYIYATLKALKALFTHKHKHTDVHKYPQHAPHSHTHLCAHLFRLQLKYTTNSWIQYAHKCRCPNCLLLF